MKKYYCFYCLIFTAYPSVLVYLYHVKTRATTHINLGTLTFTFIVTLSSSTVLSICAVPRNAGFRTNSITAHRCPSSLRVFIHDFLVMFLAQLPLSAQYIGLFHDLLLRCYLYHCVWCIINAHNLTPEKRDNNCSPHPLTLTSCLRNNIQLIHVISPCCGCL